MQQHVEQRGIEIRPFWKVIRFIPFIELFILSIDLALIFQSVMALFVSIAIFATVYPIQELRTFFYSAGWGIVGCFIGFMFGSVAGMAILATLFFFTSIGVHIFGFNELLNEKE